MIHWHVQARRDTFSGIVFHLVQNVYHKPHPAAPGHLVFADSSHSRSLRQRCPPRGLIEAESSPNSLHQPVCLAVSVHQPESNHPEKAPLVTAQRYTISWQQPCVRQGQTLGKNLRLEASPVGKPEPSASGLKRHLSGMTSLRKFMISDLL